MDIIIVIIIIIIIIITIGKIVETELVVHSNNNLKHKDYPQITTEEQKSKEAAVDLDRHCWDNTPKDQITIINTEDSATESQNDDNIDQQQKLKSKENNNVEKTLEKNIDENKIDTNELKDKNSDMKRKSSPKIETAIPIEYEQWDLLTPLPRKPSLRPLANGRYSTFVPREDEEDEESSAFSDQTYSLRGDDDEDQRYFIYKIKDINLVPKKECVGKVIVPKEMLNKQRNITLEEFRKLIRQSSDEMLREAARQRFKYLAESYHLVASSESDTPINQIYPTQGVFIKLDSEPYPWRRDIDNSLTSRLQVEYERKYGPIVSRKRIAANTGTSMLIN